MPTSAHPAHHLSLIVAQALLDQPMYFANGLGVKSLKAQNREVAKWLPARNSSSYQAMVDYLKFMLGAIGPRALYPASPDPSELRLLPQVSLETILADQSVFCGTLPPPTLSDQTENLLPRQDPCWFTYRRVFLNDLAWYRIPRATLAWESPATSSWNKTMLVFLMKHWRWANARGAFNRYSVDTKYSTDAICRAVMERWMHGRVKEDEKYRNQKKKSQRRAAIPVLYTNTDISFKLFRYRVDALDEFCKAEDRELLSTALSLLPSADCCSDTEDDGPGRTRAIGMVWRSQEFADLLHVLDELSFQQQKALHGARWGARRLEMRRSPATQISCHGKAP
ncbi:uncharacterized protein MELLADRAFT_58967 [Melampsora larici-populina 98AG31]|uniref:Uncharacterized protein n=1 Tax=Melampsora larici-populina (strain 98AG31 / pathotype 3-4-7) TaxID=747676 RepID=F4R6K6_MELLP|nr:uncharacterized protein MELLADRAFT_58967 [Melampsora larici-populina 98AG31]EGG11897.1 hypothetical protein MELLADRAFT_58967 [Melampsora larici-populina 98AG31]